jgi:hypothetical protein
MRRRILIVIAVIVTAVGSLGGWLYYSFSHMSIPFTVAEATDVQLAFKGALGEGIFGSVNDHADTVSESNSLNSVIAPAVGSKSDGLIADYQRNPEKFRRYAQMFDTAVSARRIGEAMQPNWAN